MITAYQIRQINIGIYVVLTLAMSSSRESIITNFRLIKQYGTTCLSPFLGFWLNLVLLLFILLKGTVG